MAPAIDPTPTTPRALDDAAALAHAPHACVLDARPAPRFAAGHLAGAGRMTPGEFGPRRSELPPRTTPVLVVHDDPAAAREAAEVLAALLMRDVAWLDAPLAALPGGLASVDPPARMWRPAPFLALVTPLLPAGRALDVAAGAGRDSVHLALAGWQVEAWDHDPEALARAERLAAAHGVAVATRVVDVAAPTLPDPGAGWDVIVVCRFLHRPLFPWLEAALAPGGALVYETFRRGQEAYGRPLSDRHLLEPGELAHAFPTLAVELYEESEPPGGPIMAHLLARRPATPRR